MYNKNKTYSLILIGLCFLVYANSLNNAFVSDDLAAILENNFIAHPFHFWTDPSSFLNSICYLIAKTNPFIYHLISIILHAVNTILVFFFLRLFFKLEASFLAACIFAVHPIHSEAVTWVSGRPYLILAFFILSAYLLYHSATNIVEKNRKINIRRYILCILVFSYFIISNYGFYSFFPPLLILSDITFNRWRRNWKLWIPFLCILALIFILVIKSAILQRSSYLIHVAGFQSSLMNPILKLELSFFSHLLLLLWPVKLTLYHGSISYSPFLFNIGLVSLILLIPLVAFLFKKAKELFFAVFIFILFLAPTYMPLSLSNLVAERYLYFPSITLSMVAAFLYQRYGESYDRNRKIKALSLFTAVMVIYAVRTIIRNEDWKTPERFWQSTIAVSYNSPSAHVEAGVFYHKKGEIEKALGLFKKAIELNPRYPKAYNNLGNLYNDLGKNEEAIAIFKKAIEVDPGYIEAYNNLANTYSDMGKKEEALSLYKKVIEINPKDPDAYYNLANVYSEMGKEEEAITFFKKAIKINPRDVSALNNLGVIYVNIGKGEEAEIVLSKAIEIEPLYAAAYFNLAKLYFQEKEYVLAIKHCDRAVELGYKVPAEFLIQLRAFQK